MGREGEEYADDGDEEGRSHPGHRVRLEHVELHPTQDHYLNLK